MADVTIHVHAGGTEVKTTQVAAEEVSEERKTLSWQREGNVWRADGGDGRKYTITQQPPRDEFILSVNSSNYKWHFKQLSDVYHFAQGLERNIYTGAAEECSCAHRHEGDPTVRPCPVHEVGEALAPVIYEEAKRKVSKRPRWVPAGALKKGQKLIDNDGKTKWTITSFGGAAHGRMAIHLRHGKKKTTWNSAPEDKFQVAEEETSHEAASPVASAVGAAVGTAVAGALAAEESNIPWVKVQRDPEKYAAYVKAGEKIGPIDSPKKVYELLGEHLSKEDQEVFLILLCNIRAELRGVVEVHRGERSRVSVNLADVMRPILISGAEMAIAVHQHPSGKAMPSKADRDLTREIEASCKPFGVLLADHCVIGLHQVYSIKENKLHQVK